MLLATVSPTVELVHVDLTWDLVNDERVAIYEVWYGQVSGEYDRSMDAVENSVRVPGLEPGEEYFFAVRACNADRTLCSHFSNEVSAARFSSSFGDLTCSYADVSSDDDSLATGSRDHSDGKTARWIKPHQAYAEAGSYRVTLTVTDDTKAICTITLTRPIRRPAIDTDGDELSDTNEVQWGAAPLVADTDGDGMSDEEEVAAGRLPTVNESAVVLEILNLLLLEP